MDPAVRSSLESVLVALKVDLKGSEGLPEKVAKIIDSSDELKGINKEMLDMTVIKSILTKRTTGSTGKLK